MTQNLMSVSNVPDVEVRLHAWSSNNIFESFGRTYIEIINRSNDFLRVMGADLDINDRITLGFWSTASRVDIGLKDGLNIDAERHVIYHDNNIISSNLNTHDVYTSRYVTKSAVRSVENFFIEKNDDKYNLLSYNCISFALDSWNALTKDNLGWFGDTAAVRNKIISMSAKDTDSSKIYDKNYQYNTNTSKLEVLSCKVNH